MRKLIIEEWLSVDGHAADQDGGLDFFTRLVRDSYAGSDRARFLDGIDTLLFGHNTYTQFAALWPGRSVDDNPLARMVNTTEKIVFSKTLQEAPWGSWPPARVEGGEILTAISELKSAPGKNMVLWGSVQLAQTLMAAGLADELHLHLCPTLTGGGRRFFAEGIAPRQLQLEGITQYPGGIAHLKYTTKESV